MSIRNSTMIAIMEARHALEGLPEDVSLEDRCRVAMKTTWRHWMVTDEEEQFKAAIGAVLLTTDGDDKDRVEQTMRSLNTLSALFSRIPIDMEQVEMPEKPLPLLNMWKEVQSA